MDEDEDSGDIQLLSHSNTGVQSPTSQTDSAFEDMVSSNQVSLSSTLEDVKDISDTLEPIKVTVTESQPTVESSTKMEEEEEIEITNQAKVEFTPTQTPQSSIHSSYVTEVPLSESKTFVKKAQQFSEIVNQPPKMTIRSTSKEMSDEHLQKVDGERKAVLSQSIVKRRGITEFSTVRVTEGKMQLTLRRLDVKQIALYFFYNKPFISIKKKSRYFRFKISGFSFIFIQNSLSKGD